MLSRREMLNRSGLGFGTLGLASVLESAGLLREAQERGFHLQPEIKRNTDLEILRGRKEFQALLA